jgi:hypothetical protein
MGAWAPFGARQAWTRANGAGTLAAVLPARRRTLTGAYSVTPGRHTWAVVGTGARGVPVAAGVGALPQRAVAIHELRHREPAGRRCAVDAPRPVDVEQVQGALESRGRGPPACQRPRGHRQFRQLVAVRGRRAAPVRSLLAPCAQARGWRDGRDRAAGRQHVIAQGE